MKPFFADLGNLTEDARIEMIGKVVLDGKIVGFMVDDDSGKADRYISKLKAKFPDILIIGRFDGPTPGVVTVKVGPPLEGENSTAA